MTDKKEHSLREAIEYLADEFKLTEEERKKLLPSGQQFTFDNRVGWARTYLKKAELIETTKRAYFKISDRGIQVLKEKPAAINIKYLDQFSEFIKFRRRKKDENGKKDNDLKPPEELIESAYQSLRDNLAGELLQSVKNCSPSFFEKLVVDLLVKMGYGGTRKDAGQAVGRTGDGGIDGIIKEDRLGLDIVYIQAKKWENTIGRPEIQKFAGALQRNEGKKRNFYYNFKFLKGSRELCPKYRKQNSPC